MGEFLKLVASHCYHLHMELEALGGHATRRVAIVQSKMVFEVHSPSHLALVEAWEHYRCLDITVLERRGSRSKTIAAGPCPTDEEVASRLEALKASIRPKPAEARA